MNAGKTPERDELGRIGVWTRPGQEPMNAHTPGPWQVQSLEKCFRGYRDWPTFAVRDSVGNQCLAVVGDIDRATAPNNEANACLIAASPALLEACKAALRLDYMQEHNALAQQLKSAIAAATGGKV